MSPTTLISRAAEDLPAWPELQAEVALRKKLNGKLSAEAERQALAVIANNQP